MESFLLAIGAVFPMLIYMTVGGLTKKLKIMSEDNFKRMNEMIFRVLIPISLFFDIYTSDLKTVAQPKLFIFAGVMVLVVFVSTWLLISRLVKDKADSATVVQGIFRSNYVLFGTVLCSSLCGEEGAAISAALAVVVVPMFNMLSVILFETLRGGGVKPERLILQIFKNPLVDAALLGMLCNLVGLPIPGLLASPFTKLGSIASPLALFTLGGLLSFRSMASHRGLLLSAVAGRLIVVPLIAVVISIALGFREAALVALLSAFASPTAVSSAPMAQSMGGNGALAGEIVAVSSAASILTIFVFSFALSSLGLI